MRPSKISSARGTMPARLAGSARSAATASTVGAVTTTPLQRLARAARQVVVLVDRAGDHHHVGAFGGEAFGERGTDAATRAGHDDVLAGEAIHEVSLPSR